MQSASFYIHLNVRHIFIFVRRKMRKIELLGSGLARANWTTDLVIKQWSDILTSFPEMLIIISGIISWQL